MKYLPLEYIGIKRINYLYKKTYVTTKNTDDLLSILKTVTPEKTELRRYKNTENVSLILYPDVPFGPDPQMVIDQLFENFEEALELVADHYRIDILDVLGWKQTRKSGNRRIKFQRRRYPVKHDSLDINILELFSLFHAAENNSIKRLISLSFFADFNVNYSFIVSPPSSIEFLTASTAELMEILSNKEDILISDPVSGKNFFYGSGDNKEITFDRDTLILINNSENRSMFKPEGNFLFPFPYFKRKIVFKKTKVSEILPGTCINCLACTDYCPAELNPSYIYHLVTRNSIEEAVSLHLEACILCGKCSFVCPSYLPICQVIEKTQKELKEIS